MGDLFGGKKPKAPPPQPKPKEEVAGEFDLMRRRASALNILTNGFSANTPLGR